MHPLARLLDQKFCYISIDLSHGAYIAAWRPGPNGRRAYSVKAPDFDAAVDALIEKARADTITTDSAQAVSSMFEDILG